MQEIMVPFERRTESFLVFVLILSAWLEILFISSGSSQLNRSSSAERLVFAGSPVLILVYLTLLSVY
jgi:hypothetical protein